MHVPADRHAAWFDQILNEKRVSFMSNGRRATTWRPRASGVRTEALDCRVYAKAALEGLKRVLGGRLGVAAAAATPAAAASPDNSAPIKTPSGDRATHENPEIQTQAAPRTQKKVVAAKRRPGSSLWR
jgi:phage terminase large subunit GpA-like protein